MADTIAVMNGGRIEQAGGAAELYERPRTEFVANFLGVSNLVDARIKARDNGLARLETHDGGVYPLSEARTALEAIAARKTEGKLLLDPAA